MLRLLPSVQATPTVLPPDIITTRGRPRRDNTTRRERCAWEPSSLEGHRRGPGATPALPPPESGGEVALPAPEVTLATLDLTVDTPIPYEPFTMSNSITDGFMDIDDLPGPSEPISTNALVTAMPPPSTVPPATSTPQAAP